MVITFEYKNDLLIMDEEIDDDEQSEDVEDEENDSGIDENNNE